MEGQTNKPIVNDRVNELYGNITEFHKKVGLEGIIQSTSATHYMNMSEEEMRAMTDEDCGIAANALGKFAFYIQKEYNHHVSIANRIDRAVKSMIAKEVARMTGYSYEERKQKAIKDDQNTYALDNKASEHQMKADSLAFLAKQIQYVADTFIELQRTKRGHRYERQS